MKKIVQFVHSLSSGGAETMVKDYALELKKRGYDIEVLVQTLEFGAPNEQFIKEAQIPLTPVFKQETIQKGALRRFLSKCCRHISMQRSLRNYFKRTQPDVLHVHLDLMRNLIFSFHALRNTKVFYTCHNEPSKIFIKTTLADKLEYFVLKLFLKKRNMTMIALHSQMAEEINQMFQIRNTVVLNNPINLERFRSANINQEMFRKELGIPEKAFVIGHIGRFSEQKNHFFLADVFYEVSKQRKDAFLLMIGDGPLMQEVRDDLDKKQLQGHYLILSNRKDIPQLLSVMDIFCFPSLYEGFGNVILEAQAVGLPCFISDKVPKETMLTEHIWQLNLQDGEKRWADAILSPNRPKHHPQQSLEDFDLKSVIDQLEKIYFNSSRR